MPDDHSALAAGPTRSGRRPAADRAAVRRPPLQVRLLHGFALRSGPTTLPLPLGLQRLVAFLALHDAPLRRQHVAGCLWPETSEAHAHGNLRSTLWRLRKLAPTVLAPVGDHLGLAADVRVDVRTLKARARRVLDGDGEVDLGLDHPDLAGDLLPGWYDEWVVLEGESLRQARLHAMEKVCERLADRRQYRRAIEFGLAVVAAEPLRESAHRALVRSHLAEGNLCEARRQYELCRRLLREHLDAEPSVAMRSLLDAPGPIPDLALVPPW